MKLGFAAACLALAMTAACRLPAPLPPEEVSNLTTCRTGDLGVIKKNLVLGGWSVERDDAETLETGFKQVGGVGTAAHYERIAVVRLDDHTSRFSVRVRSTDVESVETSRVTDDKGNVVSSQGQAVPTTAEQDEHYYDTSRAEYAERRQKVCGAY